MTGDEPSTPVLLGVNYRNAPLELRGAISFSSEDADAVLQATARDRPVCEAAILSTCNRTEFYLTGDDARGVGGAWLQWLTRFRPSGVVDEFAQRCYRRAGADAARHLFRVAAGLDSSILGDVQVQFQVKDAMRRAAEAGTLKSELNQLMSQAIRTGRRARADTSIASGSPTIGSAVASILDRRLESMAVSDPVVVMVGAGKAARTIARQVAQRGLGEFIFANRTPERAAALAGEYGGTAIPWSEVTDAIARADVVITATAASEPIVTRQMLQPAIGRNPRELLVIDPSVPRNVEPCPGIDLVDIDSVRERRDSDLAIRQAARPAVELIVLREVDEWLQWSARRPLEAMISALYRRVDEVSAREAARIAAAGTDGEREAALRSSFRQLLHDHVRDLRDLVTSAHPAAHNGHGEGGDANEGAPDG